MRTTIIAASVHREGESPIYDENCTHVLIEDEGSGPYILLRQSSDAAKPGEIHLNQEEIEDVLRAARRLLVVQPKLKS